MSLNSSIEWTDATWNPTAGCSKVSPGCKGCYAIREAHRMASNPNPKISSVYQGLTIVRNPQGQLHPPDWTGVVRLIPERLEIPLGWKTPRKIFVNSLSDLFHENLSDQDIIRVFEVMLECPQHTFQILTKRARRMRDFILGPWWAYAVELYLKFHTRVEDGYPKPAPNIWLGVSIEDQKTADERIPFLLETPAVVRFVSYEPALGPVKLTPYLYEQMSGGDRERDGFHRPPVGWVIAGGESGPGARPCHPDWARGIRDQCLAAAVPFFWKQWGEYQPLSTEDGFQKLPWGEYEPATKRGFLNVGKREAGRILDGREWNEFPRTSELERTQKV